MRAAHDDHDNLLVARCCGRRRNFARRSVRDRPSSPPVLPELSFAAFDGDRLVASLQSWPVAVGNADVVLVGPVAVAPDRQRSGLGRKLMGTLIRAAPDTPMVMIGDPEYYGHFFGFTAAATGNWHTPGPVERHRLLARNASGLPASGLLGPRAFALAASRP
jgi:predicted N-acetyltransferase YhbS